MEVSPEISRLTGFTPGDNQPIIDISSTATVKMTINKSIPDVLQNTETVTFDFTVKNASGVTVATPSLTFAAGETSKSVDVSGLAPDTYTVSEQAPAPWDAQDASDCKPRLAWRHDPRMTAPERTLIEPGVPVRTGAPSSSTTSSSTPPLGRPTVPATTSSVSSGVVPVMSDASVLA